MELYSGAKMVNEKALKTKYLRSKNREFTVRHHQAYRHKVNFTLHCTKWDPIWHSVT
jgi:hypothetical protein